MPRRRRRLSLLRIAGIILILAGVVAPNGYVAALGVLVFGVGWLD